MILATAVWVGLLAAQQQALPLVTVPAAANRDDALAVFVTGDGGWADLDKHVATVLSSAGVGVVALISPSYFKQGRNPDNTALDIAALARTYLRAWDKQRLLFIGYSRGADVLPFVINRLPQDLRERIEMLVLIGPERTTDFQYHMIDLFTYRTGPYVVLPEVAKLRDLHVLCIYGMEEQQTMCPEIDSAFGTAVPLPGAHHFDKNYAGIGEIILAERKRLRPTTN